MDWNNIVKIEVVYKNNTGKRFASPMAIAQFRRMVEADSVQDFNFQTQDTNLPTFDNGSLPTANMVCDNETGICYRNKLPDPEVEEDIMKSKRSFMPSGGGYRKHNLNYDTNMDAEQLRKMSSTRFE